jgi:hypothetical protein
MLLMRIVVPVFGVITFASGGRIPEVRVSLNVETPGAQEHGRNAMICSVIVGLLVKVESDVEHVSATGHRTIGHSDGHRSGDQAAAGCWRYYCQCGNLLGDQQTILIGSAQSGAVLRNQVIGTRLEPVS